MITQLVEAFAFIITTYLLTWPFLVVLGFFGIFVERAEKRGWAIFTAVVGAVLFYFYFHLTLTQLLIYSVAYLAIGIPWSFWRYKKFVEIKVDEFIVRKRGTTATPSSISYTKSELHPENNLFTITTWIIIWPFSVLDNLIGDIITGIENLVTKVFRRVYVRIFETAVSRLDEPKNPVVPGDGV